MNYSQFYTYFGDILHWTHYEIIANTFLNIQARSIDFQTGDSQSLTNENIFLKVQIPNQEKGWYKEIYQLC